MDEQKGNSILTMAGLIIGSLLLVIVFWTIVGGVMLEIFGVKEGLPSDSLVLPFLIISVILLMFPSMFYYFKSFKETLKHFRWLLIILGVYTIYLIVSKYII